VQGTDNLAEELEEGEEVDDGVLKPEERAVRSGEGGLEGRGRTVYRSDTSDTWRRAHSKPCVSCEGVSRAQGLKGRGLTLSNDL
jgi:hypothetical protein